MPTPIAIRLAVRQWLARPLRPILCSLAIAAAVALIVSVGAAMDSLRSSITQAIGRALGVAEVHVRPAQRDTDARVPESMLAKVRSLPEVEFAGMRLATMGVLDTPADHRVFNVIGIVPELDEKLRPKNYDAGHGLSGAPDELLIDGTVAEVMKVKLGDTVKFSVHENKPHMMKIVGIVERPRLEILGQPLVYAPMEVLEQDMDLSPPEYSVIDVKLRESAGIEDFDQYAKDLQKRLGPTVEVAPGTTSRARMSEFTRSLRILLLLLSTLSAFCAALIIGTTLSVGVQERVRQFGQLRCIGASRVQLAMFLLGDAGVMLAIGEVLGVALGVALSVLLVRWLPNIFAGYEISAVSLLIASGCGAGATLLGAMIPIWQVTRVPPMAAVTAAAKRARRSRVWLAAGCGALCLGVQAGLWNISGNRDFRVFSYVLAGIPLIFTGWCLLAPAAVISCEAVGARVMGVLLGVGHTLLRRSWSRTPWRAGAMIAALMIGVTLFTTVRARGQSIRSSWITPDIPDLIVKSVFSGLGEKRLERIRQQYPELTVLAPFDYFSVRMKTGDSTGALGKILGEEETTFIAVTPRQFASMVELEYVQGNPATALKELEDGQHVFVTKEFYNVRKLGVGDKVSLRGIDGKTIEFTISAVVSSTGLEVVKNYFDLRATFGEKAVSSVLGTLADGKKYFKLGDPTLMLVNVDPKVARDVGPGGKMVKLRERMQADNLQSLSSVEIKATLGGLIDRIMNGLSVIGFGAMCLASLGVANMVIASVHARQYEFGVLRAIGAGRWQLVRLVLAEVTLIAWIAGVLGTGAGLYFAFMASRVDYVLIGFPTPFLDTHLPVAVEVAAILLGLSLVLTTVLAWLASVVPAMKGAMSAQRTLLAGGRG